MSAREYSFDTLLAGMATAMAGACGAAGARYQRHLRAFANSGALPVGPAGAAVPAIELRAFRQVRVRELAMEFDCWLRRDPDAGTVQLVLGPIPRWRPRRMHRVRIELHEGPTPVGRVSIDGAPFKQVAFAATPAEEPPCPIPSS